MLSKPDKQQLLDVAAASIQYGLENGKALPIAVDDYSEPLQQQGACFVTLHINDQLRGCIGTLDAFRPLIVDVAKNAYAAAFRDPRFTPVSDSDYEKLHYHISILNPAEPMQFDSEQDLLNQLQPGIDGLTLEDRSHKGTFLPSVWESLPKPDEFLMHLKQKAGLPLNYWSDTLKVSRYTVEDVE